MVALNKRTHSVPEATRIIEPPVTAGIGSGEKKQVTGGGFFQKKKKHITHPKIQTTPPKSQTGGLFWLLQIDVSSFWVICFGGLQILGTKNPGQTPAKTPIFRSHCFRKHFFGDKSATLEKLGTLEKIRFHVFFFNVFQGIL